MAEPTAVFAIPDSADCAVKLAGLLGIPSLDISVHSFRADFLISHFTSVCSGSKKDFDGINISVSNYFHPDFNFIIQQIVPY